MMTKMLKASLMPAVLVGALAMTPTKAKAQSLDDLFDGLVNVTVFIDRFDNLIYINDVNILDYNYVPVTVVLNDIDIAILSILIQDDPVASFNQGVLDNVLQLSGILDGSQVVVGVLSDQGVIYFLQGG